MAKLEPFRRKGREGWYVDLGTVKLPDGTRRRFRCVKCEGRTMTQRREWAQRERARLAMHGPVETRKEVPTFDEMFPQHLERSAKVGGRRGKAHDAWLHRQRVSYCGTHGDKGWIRPRFGTRPVDRISARDVDRLVAEMDEAGLSASTKKHALQVIRSVLALAKRYGHVRELPDLPFIAKDPPTRTALRFEQARRAIELAREDGDPDTLLLVLLGFHAGLYPEEVMGLERDDVDLGLDCLHVRRSATDTGTLKPTKTVNRVREIPLTPSLEAALRERLARMPVGVRFLFWRRAGGTVARVTKKWCGIRVRALFRRAGLGTEEPFFRMRRTFATECKRPARRIPDVLVTRWMGHAAVSVTDRHYVDDLPMSEQRTVIALLEEPAGTLGLVRVGASWEPTSALGS